MTLSLLWLRLSPHDGDSAGRGEFPRSRAEERASIPADHPDQRTVDRLRAGDVETLNSVYRSLYRDLWRFAYTIVGAADLAEDAVNDVYVRLWEFRESLLVTTSLRAYLFTAVRHRAIDLRRREQRVVRLQTFVAGEMAAGEIPGHGEAHAHGDERVESDERLAHFRRAIEALPPAQRRAVFLRLDAGLTYPEIGSVLGISADAARMLVTRAHAELRRRLAPYLMD